MSPRRRTARRSTRPPATARPYRLRLVAHDPAGLRLVLQRRRQPDALVPPALPLGPRARAEPRSGPAPRVGGGLLAVNAGFADAVRRRARGGARTRPVFFHDYHLYLAPRLVRVARPRRALAHFVHIPWPQPDYWRVLPEAIRRAVHDGLLANDVVGFHTDRWRRNFLRSLRGHRRRRRATSASGTPSTTAAASSRRARPISVDPQEFDELAASAAVLEPKSELAARAARAARSSASTAPTRRRTSSAASGRSSCTSTTIPSCTGGWGCSRCSTRPGRTSRSTPSTSARSSGPRAS